MISVPEDLEGGADIAERAKALELGRAEDERWHLRKDESRFWASGLMVPLRDGADRIRGLAEAPSRPGGRAAGRARRARLDWQASRPAAPRGRNFAVPGNPDQTARVLHVENEPDTGQIVTLALSEFADVGVASDLRDARSRLHVIALGPRHGRDHSRLREVLRRPAHLLIPAA